MNKLIKTIFTLLVITNTFTASAAIEDSLNNVSHRDGKEYATAIESGETALIDEMNWKSFQSVNDKHGYAIQFPNKALFTKLNKNWSSTLTVENGARYMVSAAVPAMRYAQDSEIFPIIIEKHSTFPYEMMSQEVSSVDGKSILVVVSRNVENGTVEKTKVLISKENVYVANIKFPENQDTSRDEIFLNSLAVVE